MKHEWRKAEKELYGPKETPQLTSTIMIRQPDFITEDVVNKAFEIAPSFKRSLL